MSHKLIGSVVLDGPTLAASIADRLLSLRKGLVMCTSSKPKANLDGASKSRLS